MSNEVGIATGARVDIREVMIVVGSRRRDHRETATTRRGFLRLTALAGITVTGIGLLAACGGGSPAAVPTTGPASGAAATKPAGAATTAPAAAGGAATAPPSAAGSAATTAPSGATAATPAAKPATSGATAITFHARVGVQADHFTAMAQKFMEQHPNIQVKGEYFPGAEYNQKMQVAVAGGTLGDALWTASIQAFGPFGVKGILIDHTPLIAAAKFNLQELWPQAVQGVTINGKVYGLPWIVHPGRIGLYYNKGMFDKAGQKYPDDSWTYDQLHTAAKALTKESGGKTEAYGFVGADQPWGGIVFMRSYGGDYLSPDGKKVGATAPAALAGIQSLADFYGKERSAPSPTQVEGGSPQMFASNKLAMYQSGYWGISSNLQYAKDTPWGVVSMPKGPAGSKGMFEFDPVSVSKFSKAPQEAFQYLAFLISKEAGVDIAKRGSVPGARQDVWDDPELTKSEYHTVFAKIIKDTPPLLMPANFRAVEFADALSKGMDPLFIGKETDARKVLTELEPTLQAILDKPVA